MKPPYVFLGLLSTFAAMSGCASPEPCSGCVLTSSPFGVDGGDGVGGASETGGQSGGETGGANGSGGISGTGGIVGTGGASATGGVAGTGGAGTGGQGTGGGATGGAGTGGMGTGGQATGGSSAGDPDLVLWYKFDEISGTTVEDSAKPNGAAQNGALATIGTGGGATFTTTKQVGAHAVSLIPASTGPNANGGFVTAPSLHALAPHAITIAIWVNLTANTATQSWERIFDFGTGVGTTPNMYLTARASDATNTPIRFAITNSGHAATAEQRLDGSATLSPNAWHHIAVVLPAGSPFTGTLYIDGVAVATNAAMTLHATDIGATTNNWLGRSQFSGTVGSNPCFNGLLDDFRVYRRALSQAEISTLFAVR